MREMLSLSPNVEAVVPTLLVAVAVLTAVALGYSVAILLRRAGLDELFEREGMDRPLARVGVSARASVIVGRALSLAFGIAAVVVALDTFALRPSNLPLRNILAYLPRALGGLALAGGGWVFASYASRSVSSWGDEAGLDYHARLGRLVHALLLAITCLATLEQLGFDVGLLIQTFTAVVAMAAAGLALAFAFGGRAIAYNALAGYYAREQLPVGSHVRIDGHDGILEGIGAVSAEIRNSEGRLFVPNSRLIEGTVSLPSTQKPPSRGA